VKLLLLIGGLASSLLLPSHKAGPSVASSQLRRCLAEGRLAELRWPNFLNDRAAITRFYELGRFSPAWVRSGVPTPQALILIEDFEGAAAKGLNPEDYDAGRWNARLERLRAADTSPSEIARFDLALTVSALRFASDLEFGRVNPQIIQFGLYSRPDRLKLADWIRSELVNSSDVTSALEIFEPPFAEYRRTQQALAAYRKLAAEGENDPLPSGNELIKPGDFYPAAVRLKEFLQRVGDWSGSSAMPDLPGSSPLDNLTYAGQLVDAVKRFQSRHGLAPDGIIGPLTINALNVPLTERVRQIELALERWRWLSHTSSRRSIIVNIPEFELRALDESGRVALRMKVIAGRADGYQTPVFSALMTYLIFRPYWDVPDSIASEELLPKAAEDPEYLARNHYELVPLPMGGFRIRQGPGPDNALGGVKFLLPNEYNVYLHATPAVTLFSKSRRDFSHGCIRVEKPEELAQWVLRSNPGWDQEHIREAMNDEQALRVNLSMPVAVFVVYQTVAVDENGEVRFFNDIYGQDASLEEALAAGRFDQVDGAH
jgi:L,D-transpeptidase YcbB